MQNFDYSHIKRYLPHVAIGWHEAVLIERQWKAFYDNPSQFENTDLPAIIEAWLAEESPKWKRNEYGDWIRRV